MPADRAGELPPPIPEGLWRQAQERSGLSPEEWDAALDRLNRTLVRIWLRLLREQEAEAAVAPPAPPAATNAHEFTDEELRQRPRYRPGRRRTEGTDGR